MSMFEAANAKLPSVKDAEGNIQTEQWLAVGRLTLPVIGERDTVKSPTLYDVHLAS